MRFGFRVHLKYAHVGHQHDLAAQLTLILREVFRTVQWSVDNFGGYGAVGRWGLRQRKSDEGTIFRLDDRAVKFLVLPQITERPPRFEMNVFQSVRLQTYHDPLRCSAVIRRACNAWAIDLGEIEEV